MTDATTLPLIFPSEKHAAPEITWIERRGDALHPTPLFPGGEVLGLNLMRGCAFQCGFCSVRAYRGSQTQQGVTIFANTVEQVIREVKRKRPRAVLICPSTDPFPPFQEAQDETSAVVNALSHLGVQSWLMTRGVVLPSVLQTLNQHRDLVKITFGLTTMSDRLHQILEPGTASPRLRLEQIERCLKSGFQVKVAIDPLVPCVTDTRDNLSEVLEALESVGIDEVTTGYMFLRQGIAENLSRELESTDLAEVIQSAFRTGPVLTAPGLAPAKYLPRGRRQRGFALVKALAARHGIEVTISRVSNPDFVSTVKSEVTSSQPGLLATFLKGSAQS